MLNNPNDAYICINEIQKLLIQLSNHVYKINEIIAEMNNIINNQMNNCMMAPMNNLMNQMNNFLNFHNINQNFMFDKEKFDIFKKKGLVNVIFRKKDQPSINIVTERNTTFKNVLQIYFNKIGLNLLRIIKKKCNFYIMLILFMNLK